jgi:hypothetical protein
MTRRRKTEEYKAILAKYPDDMPIRQIASLEGVGYGTLQHHIRANNLRPPSYRKPVSHPLLSKLFNGRYTANIARHGGASEATLSLWRIGRRVPNMAKFLDVCKAAGLVIDVVDKSILDDLMKRVNELRQQDISGPEACAEISDMIMDLIEGETP